MRNIVLLGDVREQLKNIPDGSVQTCVTSPPYWGLRDYGTGTWQGGDPSCQHSVGDHAQDSKCRLCGATRKDAQIGIETTPAAYVAEMVTVFREVRRVLRDDGTLWLNLGDSYVSTPRGNKNGWEGSGLDGINSPSYVNRLNAGTARSMDKTRVSGLKPKDLVGIPWRVALALQDDGWYLRSDIIWSKNSVMPESVRDRPTKAHEYIFLLTKSERYFYDDVAVREPASANPDTVARQNMTTRNRRTVWTINPRPYKEAHFATFPEELPEVCIKAGTSEKGACPTCGSPWERTQQDGWEPTCKCGVTGTTPCLVLDPFSGSGTTLAVAKYLRRDYLGVELNPSYHKLIEKRLRPAEELESERQGFDFAMSL